MMIWEHSLQIGFMSVLREYYGLAPCVVWSSSPSPCVGSVTETQRLRTPCWAACVWLWGLPEMDMVWGVRIPDTQRAAPALSASHIPPSVDRSPSLHLSIRSPICASCYTETVPDWHLCLPIHGYVHCSSSSKWFSWENWSSLKCLLANLNLYTSHLRLLGAGKIDSEIIRIPRLIWFSHNVTYFFVYFKEMITVSGKSRV